MNLLDLLICLLYKKGNTGATTALISEKPKAEPEEGQYMTVADFVINPNYKTHGKIVGLISMKDIFERICDE